MPFDGNTRVDAIGKILLDAADLIETRGHAKKVQEDADGRLCLHGAILLAIRGDVGPYELFHEHAAATRRIAAHRPDLVSVYSSAEAPSFAWWNNLEERTGAEVVAMLRASAVTA